MSVLALISRSHYCLDIVKEKLTWDTSHSFSSFSAQLVTTRINTLTLYSLSKSSFLHSERKVCLISAFALISYSVLCPSYRSQMEWRMLSPEDLDPHWVSLMPHRRGAAIMALNQFHLICSHCSSSNLAPLKLSKSHMMLLKGLIKDLWFNHSNWIRDGKARQRLCWGYICTYAVKFGSSWNSWHRVEVRVEGYVQEGRVEEIYRVCFTQNISQVVSKFQKSQERKLEIIACHCKLLLRQDKTQAPDNSCNLCKSWKMSLLCYYLFKKVEEILLLLFIFKAKVFPAIWVQIFTPWTALLCKQYIFSQ